MRMTGHAGVLLAGARPAATLGKWRCDVGGGWPPFNITAHLKEDDEFWLEHRPLRVELSLGGRTLSWESNEVSVHKGLATIGVQGRPKIESEG